ncbi:MAG: hypothetical protein SCH70_09640 [Candidatus Methanoperedens sp.]|nr:hypothetical protein [Candidatus Methanoperedens sp.]
MTAMTSFFRTIVPVITFVVKQFKNLVTLLGGGDAKRGANLFGLVLGGLAFAGLLSKTIGLAGTLVGKFIKLKEVIQLIRAGQVASLIGGAGGGILGNAGKGVPKTSGPVIIPTGGKVPKPAPAGKLPTILAGGRGILTRALPAAAFITIAAGMGYVAYDAYSNHKKWLDEYNTNPEFKAGVDQAKWSEHLAESEFRLSQHHSQPDVSNLINAYNPSKKQAVNDLQESIRRADINVNITADPMFVAKVNQAMSKDAKVTAWVNYRT